MKFHVFELSSSPEGFLGQVDFPPFLDAIAFHSSFRSPFSPPRLRRSFKKNRSAPAKPAATAAATPFLSCLGAQARGVQSKSKIAFGELTGV